MTHVRAALILFSVWLVSGCASVKPPEDLFYVPDFYADSGASSLGAATYDPAAASFTGIADSTTAAFYTGQKDTVLKKTRTVSALEMISSKKESFTKFRPNTEDIMLLKAGFIPGIDVTVFFSLLFYTFWSEESRPNTYAKELFFDIDKVKGDFIESEYVLAALNRGNSAVKDLYIVDVLAQPVEFVSSRYSTQDLFIPLNVGLAAVNGIEQKLVTEGDKKVLIFHVMLKEGGIRPGDMVQIVVKVRVRKDELMKPKYLVK